MGFRPFENPGEKFEGAMCQQPELVFSRGLMHKFE
jgi:hypothetical protein